MPQEARIAILTQAPDADGRGLQRRLHRRDAGRRASKPSRRLPLSRARTPARIPRSDVVDPRRPAPIGNAALLSHSLLAGDAGGPSRRSRAPRRPERASRRSARGRLWFANGAGRAAAGVDLRAPGGGLFAGLRPDRTHQFRLRRNRRRGRLCGGDRGARHARLAARPLADRSLRARGRGRVRLGVRVGAGGVHSAAPGSGSAGAGGDRGPGDFPARAPASHAGRPVELDEPAAQPAVRARARGRLCGRRHADGLCRQRPHARRRSRSSSSSSASAASGANCAPMPTIRSPPN